MKDEKGIYTATLYGVINCLMCTPVAISFCSIIFRHQAYAAFMPQLVKLVLFSSAIHQLSFCMLSSLPFAIGQVQDAGLIFLSAMAANIADSCLSNGTPSEIIPTTLVILSICTLVLGLLLVVVAKLNLASLVQYIPMPVIGGYLAFIGFFCGEAGLAMMSGLQIVHVADWEQFVSYDAIALALPGLVAGMTMYFLLRQIHSPFVLPCCMLIVLGGFYAFMLLTGMGFEEARAQGWIAPLAPMESVMESWSLYDISQVNFQLFPSQLPSLLAMFLVVAFSSSLDIAAIEMELGLPLDYNKELQTVGLSNFFSGLLGGYTGSYIFSQTIFTLRRGVSNRLAGFIVAIGELCIVFLPISITSYIPKMFFGSLLVLIATDLMYEWLYACRAKMVFSEYLICVLTFFAIQAVGIELGMTVGVLAAMVMFVFVYSTVQFISPRMQTSTVVRTFEERTVLLANRGKILTVGLNGYIFFGSAVKVLEEITKMIEETDIPQPQQHQQQHAEANEQTALLSPISPSSVESRPRLPSIHLIAHHAPPAATPAPFSRSVSRTTSLMKTVYDMSGEEIIEHYETHHGDGRSATSSPVHTPRDIESGQTAGILQHSTPPEQRKVKSKSTSMLAALWEEATIKREKIRSFADLELVASKQTGPALYSTQDTSTVAGDVITDFLILDFTHVLGVDATAARSCFRCLVSIAKEAHVTLLFAGMRKQIDALLRVHGVIKEDSIVRGSLDDALEWAEEQVLRSHKNNHIPSEASKTLQSILEDYLEIDSDSSTTSLLQSSALDRYFRKEEVTKGQVLFSVGQRATKIYFVEHGTVDVLAVNPAQEDRDVGRSGQAVRVNKICSGGAFGEADFILGHHSVRAVALTACTCWTLSRDALAKMEIQQPQLCMLIQHVLLKSLSIASTWGLFAVKPTVGV